MNARLQENRQILIFENSHTLTNFLLKKYAEIAQRSVEISNIFNAAFSGGQSPVEFYCRLSGLEDYGLWQKTHIFLADERFVPIDHPDSNFRMIKSNLLDYVNIPKGNIHPVLTGEGNILLATEEYKVDLMRHFSYQRSRLPRFDFILLGTGEDGHTASLFPGVDRIDDPNLVTIPVSLPHLKHERVSLSLSVINNARNVVILMTGATKAAIVKKIINERFDCPAAKVQPKEGKLICLLDNEAAKGLSFKAMEYCEQDAVAYKSISF